MGDQAGFEKVVTPKPGRNTGTAGKDYHQSVKPHKRHRGYGNDQPAAGSARKPESVQCCIAQLTTSIKGLI
jgi:hypothetical protein